MANLQTINLPATDEALFRHNVRVESFFSAFNGIFLGLTLFAAPVVAVKGVEANAWQVTILVSAFPVGAFLGPLWAYLGRRWGMKNLVLIMMLCGSLPLLSMYWVRSATVFTALLAFAQFMVSAMRMGQASLYRLVYPPERRGRVLGWLTFWTYATLVASAGLTGWLLDKDQQMYRYVYPIAGMCGLIGCGFFSLLRLPVAEARPGPSATLRRSFGNVERVLRNDRLYLLFELAFFLTGGSFFLSNHVILLLTERIFRFGALELTLYLVVIPKVLLALGSPMWGRILDRFGLIRCRMLISGLLSGALMSYCTGLMTGIPHFIFFGCFLQGLSNGGGQLTWFLGSSSLAPRTEDVPLYNGIHFVLNGVRGLLLPSVGSLLFLFTGTGAVAAAIMVSLGSLPVLWRALALKDERLGSEPWRLTGVDSAASPSSQLVPVQLEQEAALGKLPEEHSTLGAVQQPSFSESAS